jgi:hypothetical protein
MDKAGAILVLSDAFDTDPKHSLPEPYIERIVTGALDILYDRGVILMDEYEAETWSAMNYGEGYAEGHKEFEQAKSVLERYYNAEVQTRILNDDFPTVPVTLEAHTAGVMELRAATDVARQLLGLSPLWDTGPAPRDCE